MTPPFPGAPEGAGGAPAFLQFLSTELRPYLAARYRTNAVTVLVGHSMTGLFTTWAFGQGPDYLTGAIALSPSLPIANGGFARQALDGIKARKSPGRLFLAIGSEAVEMVGAAQSFAADLNAPPAAGRDVQFHQIPDASHSNTPVLGLIPGLQFIFRPVSLGGNQLMIVGTEVGTPKLLEIFERIREAYVRGAQQLGLPERLPFSFLEPWSRAQETGLAPFSLRVCQELIASYPARWNGYECAGDAQVRLGRADEAAENYARALETARRAGDTATAERIARKLR
jgi:hypothetical protein